MAILTKSVRAGGNFARYGLYHGISKVAVEHAFGTMKPLPGTLIPAFMTSMVLSRHYGPEYALKNSLLSSLTSVFIEKGASVIRKAGKGLASAPEEGPG